MHQSAPKREGWRRGLRGGYSLFQTCLMLNYWVRWRMNHNHYRQLSQHSVLSKDGKHVNGECQMKHVFLTTLFLVMIVPFQVHAGNFDGDFHLEFKASRYFKAALKTQFKAPGSEDCTIRIFSPRFPNLFSQNIVDQKVFCDDNDNARVVTEHGPKKRKLLVLEKEYDSEELKDFQTVNMEIKGTLKKTALVPGKAHRKIKPLSDRDRQLYLSPSKIMDFGDLAFIKWKNKYNFNISSNEKPLSFAHRVFCFLIENGQFKGGKASYESRRPSRVCQSLITDCAGFSLLFTAVMRSNDIPARTLFGRWAKSQTGPYGQFHVIAQFYIDGIGWIPVDVNNTITHHPGDKYALFGNMGNWFLTWHFDSDLEPSKGWWHGWAQYLIFRRDGVTNKRRFQIEGSWSVESKVKSTKPR